MSGGRDLTLGCVTEGAAEAFGEGGGTTGETGLWTSVLDRCSGRPRGIVSGIRTLGAEVAIDGRGGVVGVVNALAGIARLLSVLSNPR